MFYIFVKPFKEIQKKLIIVNRFSISYDFRDPNDTPRIWDTLYTQFFIVLPILPSLKLQKDV